jgi:hypothetical protein
VLSELKDINSDLEGAVHMSNAVETVVESNVTMGSVVEGKKKDLISRGANAPTPGTFISPWTMDSNQSNHSTVFQHGLGTIPQSLLILFSPDGDTVFPLQWPWPYETYSGNPVTISMTATNITLNIYSGSALHGTWNAVNNTWTKYTSGYWMVIAKAAA